MDRSLITKDLQQKPHDHIKTGRKCRGVRGQAGLPWVSAVVPEGYFSGWGGPP